MVIMAQQARSDIAKFVVITYPDLMEEYENHKWKGKIRR